ncbi:hypothetical protein FRB99_002706 [Tulasnella sp. 403]|nr:hypothetical protein FRB99_002706 [Tulasnella sp. 403]
MEVHHYPNGVNGNGTSHLVNGAGAGPSKSSTYGTTPSSTHLGTSTPDTSAADGLNYPSPSSHNESIVNHIYTSGFQHGNYADTHLHVLNRLYRLHAIILSRSPYLAHLINTSNANQIYVPLEDEPLITEEGFAIALGYLYSSVSTTLITSSNARSVLAAACLLGGMEDLCITAYETCKDGISIDTINDWIQFLDHPDGRSPSPTSTPSTPSTPIVDTNPTSVLGPYTKRLREDVLAFLVTALPQSLQAFPHAQHFTNGHVHTPRQLENGESGYDALVRIYSSLPFDIFKQAVESPAFPVGLGGDQARYRFTKEVIAARKKLPISRDAEESVVLAFGKTDGGSNVHVTRKMKKRPLWKVAK